MTGSSLYCPHRAILGLSRPIQAKTDQTAAVHDLEDFVMLWLICYFDTISGASFVG